MSEHPTSPSPSLWEYVRARLARAWPRLFPAGWQRDEAWFAAIEAQAAAPPAGPGEPTPAAAAAPPPAAEPRPTPTPEPAATPVPPTPPTPRRATAPGPWALSLALVLALAAQLRLEPPHRAVGDGLLLYTLAAAFGGLALLRREFPLTPPPRGRALTFGLQVHTPGLVLSAALALLAFLAFGGNRFHSLNLTLWAALLGLLTAALLPPEARQRARDAWHRWRTQGISLRVSPWQMAVLGLLALTVFLRFYRLSTVPREMFSDHAEKLYDVMDVLDGQWHIFFPRNTGREGMHMYAAALAARLGAGISFMALKLPMAVAAAAFLPAVYALGRLWDHRRTGFWALAFVGVAYWLHMVHRVGLRFMLYPAFAAWVLFFLLRGLQQNRRDDFVWAGLFLGLGLHGYSPFRIMPVVVVLTLLWYAVHHRSRAVSRRLAFALVLVVLVSVAVFLPLLRFMLEAPEVFFYRMNTRWAQVERPYPGPPLLIFVTNVARALVMFWWDNGTVWADSIMHRPALDPVAGGLFFVGLLLLAARYLRHRRWQDGWLLWLVPVLQLPSTLALAFPEENPTLHRTGAAMVPVFLIIGLAVNTWQQAWAQRGRSRLAWSLAGLLWLASWQASHGLVFDQYVRQYRLSNWNTPEIGQVVGGFARSVGEPDKAWVIPYPYWVDTRLVGIEAGYPRKDYALFPELLEQTLSVRPPKLFILKPEDQATLEALWALYPQGRVWRYRSPVQGKDFLMYFVGDEAR